MPLSLPVPEAAPVLRLSELVGALSHALDLGEGQPPGHAVRCCWIGMHVGREIGLPEDQLSDLYYTLLLEDLGGSSDAARIHELYEADDRSFKRAWRTVDGSLSQFLRFVGSHVGAGSGQVDRWRLVARAIWTRNTAAAELVRARSARGADLARRMGFSDRVAEGIASLDERWDGSGQPARLAGDAIPVLSRIALLARIVDVFRFEDGPGSARAEVRRRAGTWLDPELVAAFERVAGSASFWATLASPDVASEVAALEPGRFEVAVDDDRLDDIAIAFGEVIDAKSPYTSGHSARVADLADGIARELDLSEPRRRWLRRGALLHDLGKLGVGNTILDKPGKLEPDEWATLQQHVAHTEAILSRVGAFAELATMAGAHHERLDGTGYPKGLAGDAISLETRIVTAVDVFDALTSARPYRGPMSAEQALGFMASGVGTSLDPACFEALKRVVGAERGKQV